MERSKNPDTESSTMRNILITSPHYEPAHLGGGPIQTLKALVKAVPDRFEIEIICLNHDFGEDEPLVSQPNKWLMVGKSKVNYVEGGLWKLITAFRGATNPDLVYLNSLFSPTFSLLPIVLWRLGIWRGATVLIAPRGELDPGALALKARKKKWFLNFFNLLHFPEKFIWHASSQIEAAHIRKALGKEAKVVIRENETSLPMSAVKRGPRTASPFRLVFASRLHEKKGLHVLLDALIGIEEDIHFDVIGAFEDPAYEARCRSIVRDIPQNIKVQFLGSLPREAVLKAFHQADLFAFPTAGENFGHVIAEALSQSCPVMCSPHTLWSDMLQSGGGMVVASTESVQWRVALKCFIDQGETKWENSAKDAGRSFTQWRNASKGKHVFELTEQLL